MTENWRRVRQTTTVEVRLGSWQSREFWLREANQTAFLAVTRSAASKFCCREAPSDEGSRPTDSESGGCRLIRYRHADDIGIGAGDGSGLRRYLSECGQSG